MQHASNLYRSILAGKHWKETKIIVNGVEYNQSSIVSLSTYSALYAEDKPMVGSCVSGEIDLVYLFGESLPPSSCKIEVFVRVANEHETSEWLPKGMYFADTRVRDPETKTMTIHGFDAMLKAEQMFLTAVDDGDWPRPATVVVEEIAEKMGVSVDPRTIINHDLKVPYPVDYTCRELLSQIAVAHVGNWVITDSGQLRLIGLADIPAETSLLITPGGEVIKFGEVAIIVG